MITLSMKLKLLTPTAKIPTRATDGASAFDFYADTGGGSVSLHPRSRILVKTGVAVELPRGLELQIRPRSGLAAKRGVVAHLGTIDSDYRGEVGVILFNHSDAPFLINHGDRIAQGAVCMVSMCEIEVVSALSETERGAGGFGSTGK